VGVQGRNRGFGRDDRIGGPKNGDKRGMEPGGVGPRKRVKIDRSDQLL